MSTPKAVAQKNGDGSYTVRVFSAFDRSTDVVFPYDPETERLALEYVNFKNSLAVSGPLSPATQAVVADLKAMDGNDLHEQLMSEAEENLVQTFRKGVDVVKNAKGLVPSTPTEEKTLVPVTPDPVKTVKFTEADRTTALRELPDLKDLNIFKEPKVPTDGNNSEVTKESSTEEQKDNAASPKE